MSILWLSEILVCKDLDVLHTDEIMLNNPDEQKVLNISHAFENHYFKIENLIQ